MCKGSINAKLAISAVAGSMVTIGINPLHQFGVFHEAGVSPDDCVVCVDDKQRLTLSDIPVELQEDFGIRDTALATFHDNAENELDQLEFDNGRMADLDLFGGYGIIAYIGELDITGSPTATKDPEETEIPRELEPA